MINIILTLDYEIFSGGKGDVKKHIINPTDIILQKCNLYNVPMTIMFEINEFLKFEEYDDILKKDLGYSPYDEIKNQLIKLFIQGNDIQLHLHPQWMDARYVNGKWKIKNSSKSITELTQSEISNLFKDSKNKIENILNFNDSNYKCIALRLTNLAWSQAPLKVIKPMIENGLIVHSLSVSENPNNNKRGYWSLDKDNKVFEFPIYSIKVPKYKMLTSKRIITALYRYRYLNNNSKEKNNNSKQKELNKNKIKKIFRLFYDEYDLKWDFCKQTSKEMIEFLKIALRNYDYLQYEIPLIMIGHSKDFFNSREFEKFLREVQSSTNFLNKVKFVKLSDFIYNNLMV